MKQINELLKEELAFLVQKETRGKFVTVILVETAKDLKNATVWISSLDPEKKQIIEFLNKSAHEFQKILGKKLDLRNIPRLYFKLDESGEHAQKIDELLDQERKKD
jgi:ribosome-binding factor A